MKINMKDEVKRFNEILKAFKINANCIDYQKVDNYSFYDLVLGTNGRVSQLRKFGDEISLQLKSPCKPSIKVMHAFGKVRLEFVHARETALNLFDYFTNDKVPLGELMCLLGQAVDGSRVWMDIAKNPHMIVSGTTGSGKSVLLHNLIANLCNYSQAQLYLMDPKSIEFTAYEERLENTTVSYSYDECLIIMNSLVEIMNERYLLIKAGESLHNLPYIVCIIDEFADLIMQDTDNSFYKQLCALAQKCRAAKIHLILCTQRPSVNVINGTIKANFPARIACRVASHTDSKIILDCTGAEDLLGAGDSLMKDNSRDLVRFQCAYTNAEEVCSFFGMEAGPNSIAA